MKGKMLIAVIQQQPFRAESFEGDPTVCKSIFPDEDRDPLTSLRDQKGFIS
jgi:hypothetical protein